VPPRAQDLAAQLLSAGLMGPGELAALQGPLPPEWQDAEREAVAADAASGAQAVGAEAVEAAEEEGALGWADVSGWEGGPLELGEVLAFLEALLAAHEAAPRTLWTLLEAALMPSLHAWARPPAAHAAGPPAVRPLPGWELREPELCELLRLVGEHAFSTEFAPSEPFLRELEHAMLSRMPALGAEPLARYASLCLNTRYTPSWDLMTSLGARVMVSSTRRGSGAVVSEEKAARPRGRA
jgi:hypothetical protein